MRKRQTNTIITRDVTFLWQKSERINEEGRSGRSNGERMKRKMVRFLVETPEAKTGFENIFKCGCHI